jgi:hypothetical protein
MIVTSDPTPLLNRIAGAHEAAMARVLDQVRRTEPHRTGRLAAGYQIRGTTETRPDFSVETVLVNTATNKQGKYYAKPVERGAWVGAGRNAGRGANKRTIGVGEARFAKVMGVKLQVGTWQHERGPHMAGNYRVRAAAKDAFPQLMGQLLPLGLSPKSKVRTRKTAKLVTP